MSSNPTQNPAGATGETTGDQQLENLESSVITLLRSLFARNEEDADRDFKHFYDRARELVDRKLSMSGTKSETRDLLGEIVFSRLRRGLRTFAESDEGGDEIKCAEWVMGALLSMNTLAEFASAFDRAILEVSAPREYSFAGMADFISMEEVMQLLGSGAHVGCLTFEKPDNRIDIYLENGRITFLDPHRMVRRILPGSGTMDYREIDEEALKDAETRQAKEGRPLFLALDDSGIFQGMDLRQVFFELGSEVLYEFLMEPEAVFFSYRRMAEMPTFAKEHDLRMGITGLLLEGNKRLDDWRTMASVFPDRYEPVEPMPDMYAKISGLNLGVVEIKLLALINGENSPKAIAELLGLPLCETYQQLVKLAREGAVVAPGGAEALRDVSMSMEESMQLAFEALDANDDQLAVHSALDSVFGDSDEAQGVFAGAEDATHAPSADSQPGDGGGQPLKVSLDFLNARDDES